MEGITITEVLKKENLGKEFKVFNKSKDNIIIGKYIVVELFFLNKSMFALKPVCVGSYVFDKLDFIEDLHYLYQILFDYIFVEI